MSVASTSKPALHFGARHFGFCTKIPERLLKNVLTFLTRNWNCVLGLRRHKAVEEEEKRSVDDLLGG